jgi:hypothetical protein
MKRDQSLYYLLFVLLIMGAFAAMAQNSYGLKILGGVAAVFGLIFGVRLISLLWKKDRKNIFALIEMSSLTMLAFILMLRVFYIHFQFVEGLFVVAGICLAGIYMRKMIYRFRKLQPINNFLALSVLIFHASIILFLLSLVVMPFVPGSAQIVGALAFILLLCFLLASLVKKGRGEDGEPVSALKYVLHYKDYSFLIISLFFLFSLYVGFNKAGMIPAIYSDEFPQAYFELVDEAASGKEKPVDGKYRYQVFKEKYDDFLKRNKIAHK